MYEITDKGNIVKVKQQIQAPKLIYLVMIFTQPKSVERREQASYDQEDYYRYLVSSGKVQLVTPK